MWHWHKIALKAPISRIEGVSPFRTGPGVTVPSFLRSAKPNLFRKRIQGGPGVSISPLGTFGRAAHEFFFPLLLLSSSSSCFSSMHYRERWFVSALHPSALGNT